MAEEPSFREHMRRFNVWASLPGVRGWTCVARNITADQVEVYRATYLHQINIEWSNEE